MMTTVYLGLGSNIDPHYHLTEAIKRLTEKYAVKQVSPWYESAAIGFSGPDFINLVIEISTSESLEDLAEQLRALELECGRPEDAQKNTSRAIDIDILLFGDYVGTWRGGELPRADVDHYAYALKPLLDIQPQLKDPRTGQPFSERWPALAQQPLRLVS